MKKWVGLAAILIGCGVYAMIRLSISRYQEANPQVEETPRAQQAEADGANPQVVKTPSAKPTKADDTKAATPEEKPGSPATAAQVEAVTQAFGDFQSALERKDYEQAWQLTSESFQSKISLEKFKRVMADAGVVFVKASLRTESATDLGGRVRLLMTSPSKGDAHVFFIQENGQWRLDDL